MADCKECSSNAKSIPYIAHESAMTRLERTIKRLWITIMLLIVMLVATNGAWLWYESQFETITQEVTQEADNGIIRFVGGDYYGEADS